jgi:hypothetical protein
VSAETPGTVTVDCPSPEPPSSVPTTGRLSTVPATPVSWTTVETTGSWRTRLVTVATVDATVEASAESAAGGVAERGGVPVPVPVELEPEEPVEPLDEPVEPVEPDEPVEPGDVVIVPPEDDVVLPLGAEAVIGLMDFWVPVEDVLDLTAEVTRLTMELTE